MLFDDARKKAWPAMVLLTAIAAVLYVLRLTSPSDLMDHGQFQPISYVLDILQNGNWLCQREMSGSITSKPPLYTWLAALSSLPARHPTELTLTLPSAVATLGIALVIFGCGQRWFGGLAGLFGALGYLLSGPVAKQVTLIRTDALFSFLVVLTAWAAFAAWQEGRSWTWFWLAAALATLTKGPLGLLLGGFGLLAAVWESKTNGPAPLRGSHTAGVILFFVLCLGWFLAAYASEGQPLIDKMLFRELLGHAGGGQSHRLANMPKPTVYFLWRFAPWSLLGVAGMVRAFAQPASETRERRAERFLVLWLIPGLVVFSLGGHIRPDLLLPLLPAAALLAGRELDRYTRRFQRRHVVALITAITVVALGLTAWFYHSLEKGRDKAMAETEGIAAHAATLRQQVGDGFPFTYVGNTDVFQYFLNSMRLTVAPETALELLRGDAPVFVVVGISKQWDVLLADNPLPVHELARWPETGPPILRLVSNHPRLESVDPVVLGVGPLTMRLDGVRLVSNRGSDWTVERRRADGAIEVRNRGTTPQALRLHCAGKVAARTLAPGEVWRWALPDDGDR